MIIFTLSPTALASFKADSPVAEAVLKRYVDMVIEAMNTGKYLYVAHPDMINYAGTDEIYEKHMKRFCSYLKEKNISTTLRQVIIPTVNDSEENILKLKKLVDSHGNVDKVELLPFRKICQVKYDDMGIEFPFGNLPEPTREKMSELEEILKK